MSVVGSSGAGKTTLAARIARLLQVPHLELDSLQHQAGWTAMDPDELRRRVAEFVTAPGWVVDGNYSAVQPLVWERAEVVVWLDLPRWTVMRSITRRTFLRWALRRDLWNGNRESLRNVASRDPERSILRWAWTTHPGNVARYERLSADPAWAALRFVRLRSRREVTAYLASVATAAGRVGGNVEP